MWAVGTGMVAAAMPIHMWPAGVGVEQWSCGRAAPTLSMAGALLAMMVGYDVLC